MRCLLLVSLLSAAWPTLAQEGASPVAQEPAAPLPEASPQDAASPPPEAAPPLVQAPAPEQVLPPLLGHPPLTLWPGERLHVRMRGGQSHSGELVSLTPEALVLRTDADHVLNLADVQQLDIRKRAVLRWAVVGGVLGGAGGGLIMGAICAAFGDNFLGCGALGLLAGGALGGGAGAVAGLALPRWSTVYESRTHGRLELRLAEPEMDVLANWFSGAGLIGELGAQLGYARDMRTSQPVDRWGGRLHLLVLLGPYLGLGPEVAWYGNTHPTLSRRPSFHIGGLLRLGSAVGPVRVSALGGFGAVDSRSNHAVASVGGELEVLLGKHLPVALEGRYNFNLERGPEPDPDSLTLGVGTRLRW